MNYKVSFHFLSGSYWTMFWMFRFCHKEPAHLLGGLLSACFISKGALQLKYTPSLIPQTILLIPLTPFLHQSEGQEDLLWLQRKQLKVCLYLCACVAIVKNILTRKALFRRCQDGAWMLICCITLGGVFDCLKFSWKVNMNSFFSDCLV